MKVQTEAFPVKGHDNNEKTPKKPPKADEKAEGREDRVTLSSETLRLVTEENQSASKTNLIDFEKAVDELTRLEDKLRAGTYKEADIHQLDEKRILFLST